MAITSADDESTYDCKLRSLLTMLLAFRRETLLLLVSHDDDGGSWLATVDEELDCMIIVDCDVDFS